MFTSANSRMSSSVSSVSGSTSPRVGVITSAPEHPARRTGERARVGELSAEVQAAQKGEELTNRNAAAAQSHGERERRGRVEEELGALAAAEGRGEQKDP